MRRRKQRNIWAVVLAWVLIANMLPAFPAVRAASGDAVLANSSIQNGEALSSEPYRPQFHFSPRSNWINDPNGLVYYEGEYHLFYQYNPGDTKWGTMFWGHAVSTDLVNWQELPIALFPDENGHAWSGSVVVDWNNTSGFGENGKPPLVAVYTSEYGGRQVQSIAYSNDKGRSWTPYQANPVIDMPSGLDVFRDPKVFWNDRIHRWSMVVSAGDSVRFYSSPDLLAWQPEGSFGAGEGAHGGVWECPDLFPLAVDGDPSQIKWVLIVSVNKGGPAVGSGSQYFIGSFDGANFDNDNSPETVLWMDQGADHYAAVTFNDIPSSDNRRIGIAWLNNWKYAETIPTAGWRGATTIPREYWLKTLPNGKFGLIQQPVRELSLLEGAPQHTDIRNIPEGIVPVPGVTGELLDIHTVFDVTYNGVTGSVYGIASEAGLRLRVGGDQYTTIGYDKIRGKLFIDRTRSGVTDFDVTFAARHEADLQPVNGKIDLRILLDRSSVEVFTGNGEAVLTDQIFADAANTGVELYAVGGVGVVDTLDITPVRPASITKSLEVEVPSVLPEDISNPDFETGNTNGWSITGSAFRGSVSDVGTYWGTRPFQQHGTYHLWGFAGAKQDFSSDWRAGVMRSEVFKLSGNGKIDFLIGGGQDINRLYVALVSAADGRELFKATGNNDEGYRRVTWNASVYLGQAVYLKLADYHTGGFGHLNADDFHVKRTDTAAPDDLVNPDFETGDLTGWTATGDAFTGAVVNTPTYWDTHEPFRHHGIYHVWGFAGAPDGTNPDARTGVLSSNPFTLSGNGKIQFLIGGGNDIDRLYVALVRASDDQILFKETGKNSESYSEVMWDASAYLGQEVYLKVVDASDGGFGHLNVDYFRVKNTGPFAYWAFDETSGKQALDQVKGVSDAVHYVFNDAKYKPSTDPEWRPGVQGGALLFDGYSTWIERPAEQTVKPKDALTIEAWVAPRSYEWGDLGQLSAIVNQHDKSKNTGYILGVGRSGRWSLQAGIDGQWFEVWADDSHRLGTNKWSFVTAVFDKAAGKMQLYLNGQLAGQAETPAGAFISPSSDPLIVGKNNHPAIVNGTFEANMFNGLIDELKLRNDALSPEQVLSDYQAAMGNAEGGVLPAPDLAFKRSVYDGDRNRPQYHMMPPGHWMNEPHAPVEFNGLYHLFYQYNPQGPYWHQIHWGHTVSTDLVHWRDLPPALAPDDRTVAPDGVWSGSATKDAEGKPVLFFTAGDDHKVPSQSIGLATSTYDQDGDNDLTRWVPDSRLVTVQQEGMKTPEGDDIWFGQFRDPFVWKDGNRWYQLVGSGVRSKGGTALLYTSDDMRNWTYQKPLFVGNSAKFPDTGQVWELPVFLPLGKDAGGNDKYIFVVSPWFDQYSPYSVKYVKYWIGTWDKTRLEFTPDQEEPLMFDYGEHFTGPSGMVDDQGRSILFSIAQDERTEQQHYDSGWAHNAGIPLVLHLRDDGKLGIDPIPSLQSLRGEQLASVTGATEEEANAALLHVQGDMLEVELDVKPGTAAKIGLSVRRSSGAEEETLLYYDTVNRALTVDRSKSSLDPDVDKGIVGGPLTLDGDRMKLHVYLDRSMVEAYADGQKSITTRVYPVRPDSLGIRVWSEGGSAEDVNLKVYRMESAYGATMPAMPGEMPPAVQAGHLANHDFEKGDLSGWEVLSGNAFTNGHVTDRVDWGWGGPFHQASDRADPKRYHYWGYNGELGGDGAVGEMKSRTFTLSGDGKIDFLIGGGHNLDDLYVALVRASDQQMLMKATGNNGEQYQRVKWDASAYIGEELYLLAVDHATGGWGHLNLDDVNVAAGDTTPPVTEIRTNPVLNDGAFTNGDITLTITAKDEADGSGLLQSEYRVNGGEWKTVSGDIVLKEEGLYRIEYRSEDRAGNVEAVRLLTVGIDRTGPVTSIAAPAETDKNDYTVQLEAADPLSGVAHTYYSVDGGAFTEGNTVLLKNAGDHHISYYSVDKAGNREATKTGKIKINKLLQD